MCSHRLQQLLIRFIEWNVPLGIYAGNAGEQFFRKHAFDAGAQITVENQRILMDTQTSGNLENISYIGKQFLTPSMKNKFKHKHDVPRSGGRLVQQLFL